MNVTSTEGLAVSSANPDVIALDLSAKRDERKARVVELRSSED